MTRHRLTLALSVAAAAVYLLMWVGFAAGWSWLRVADGWALRHCYDFAVGRPGWVTGWDVFCTVLGTVVLRGLVAVLIIVEFVRRRARVAIFLLLSVELSAAVTELAKWLAGRARPDTALVYAHGLSFPSGHALGLLVIVAALLTVYLRDLPDGWRAPALWAGVALVVATGVGRVVLNVHHPSDVLAGWALGYLYFAFCRWVCPPFSVADGTPAAPDTARRTTPGSAAG